MALAMTRVEGAFETDEELATGFTFHHGAGLGGGFATFEGGGVKSGSKARSNLAVPLGGKPFVFAVRRLPPLRMA